MDFSILNLVCMYCTRIYYRVIVYDPKSQNTSQLVGGLRFPNGVLVSHDKSFLLIAEFLMARIMKCAGHLFSSLLFCSLHKLSSHLTWTRCSSSWLQLDVVQLNIQKYLWMWWNDRYHLSGEHAGELEVFADNLPGCPDNLSPSSDGGYWVALGQVRHAGKWFNMFDVLASRPWARRLIASVCHATAQ